MNRTHPPRILLITAHCPHGPVYGAQLRTLNLARLLAQVGELEIVIFPFGPIAEAALRRTCEEFQIRGVFHLSEPTCTSLQARWQREFDPYSADTECKRLRACDQEIVEKLVEEYDVIWFQGISIPNCLGRRKWPNAVLDIDDVPSQCFAGRAREAGDLPSRFKALRKTSQWKRREKVFLDRFGILGVCSDEDRRYFGGGERIHVIPNGFETPARALSRVRSTPPRVGFVGTLRYAPNLDGMRWFINEVWPRVRAKCPEARLRLIGSGTDDGIADSGPGIDGLGYIEDSGREISTWDLTIVPILVGGGTRIKIAEAFSRRCPVVSTRQGAYGYHLTNGRECLLADSPAEMALACLRMIEDREYADRMTDHAWREFQSKWSWKAIAPRVSAAVAACLAGTAASHVSSQHPSETCSS